MENQWRPLIALFFILCFVAACATTPPQTAAPTPQVVERVVTQVVEKVVEKQVQVPVQQTVVVEKVVEKQVPAQRPKMTVWLVTSFTPLADETQKRQVLEWANVRGVDVTLVQENGAVLRPQFNAAIESNTLPDVLYYHPVFWGPRLNRLGKLLDVTDVAAKLTKQGGGVYESTLRPFTQDAKQHALPYFVATDLFYVRKDLLDAKGVAVPETWADVAKAAKAVTEKGKIWGYGGVLGMSAPGDGESSLSGMFASFGASPYGADGKTPNLNNDGARQTLALLKDLWDSGAFPPDALSWDDSGNNKAYLTGAAAMIQNSGSVLAAMRRDDPALLSKTAIVPIPRGPKEAATLGFVHALAIHKDTKQPALAKDLLEFMLTYERYNKMVEAAGTNFMPIYQDSGKLPMWQDPYSAIFIKMLPTVKAVGYPGPLTEWALEAYNQQVITQMVNRVLADKWPADQAIKEAEEKLVKIHDQLNKK